MSLPDFPGRGGQGDSSQPIHVDTPSAGAGNHLPIWLLALCGAFTAVATAVSVMSMTLQLKNYRKPSLQRAVVRIMVMVPLYAISSLIALFSLEAAFFIDAVRDLYEAFVIYTFLQLLITYLGGERSLLIILHGRPPIPHPFPFNLFLNPMDVSDPWTLLNLKRGVLQYVQIKPLLVVATVILKVTGTYKEGKFAADSGYTYISIVYNTSICLSLYCLAMFWVCVSDDLKPFRPLPKFLCVKGILFFSFWQSIAISFLVAVKAIKKVGPYTDAEHMSLALVDSLICFEMPLFAIAHQYAFQASDYIDHSLLYAARLPFIYALRDAFGLKDVWEDTKDTLKGRGVSYQAYEPAEGGLHHGLGRQKRIRAGLRYSKGGSIKYWIPMPGDENKTKGNTGPISAIKRRIDARLTAREGYAPLLPEQSAKIVHGDPDERDQEGEGNGVNRVQWGGVYGLNGSHGGDDTSDDSDAASLDFDSVDDDEDNLYERARRIGYAGFPNVDVSREEKIRRLRQEEEEIMSGKTKKTTRRSANKGKSKGLPRSQSDGRVNRKGAGKGKGKDKQSAHGVYGAWADKITQISDSSSDEDTAKAQPATSNGSGSRSKSRPRDAVDGVPDGDQGLSSAQIKWTKTNISKNLKPPSITHRWSNPDAPSKSSPFFSLGEDEDGEDDGASKTRSRNGALTPTDRPLPPDARDLVVDDPQAVDEAKARERRRGEPQTKAPTHVYVHQTQNNAPSSPSEVGEVGEGNDEEREGVDIEEVYSPGATDGTKLSDNIKQGEMPGGDPIKQLERIEERVTRPTPPAHLGNFADENNPWA